MSTDSKEVLAEVARRRTTHKQRHTSRAFRPRPSNVTATTHALPSPDAIIEYHHASSNGFGASRKLGRLGDERHFDHDGRSEPERNGGIERGGAVESPSVSAGQGISDGNDNDAQGDWDNNEDNNRTDSHGGENGVGRSSWRTSRAFEETGLQSTNIIPTESSTNLATTARYSVETALGGLTKPTTLTQSSKRQMNGALAGETRTAALKRRRAEEDEEERARQKKKARTPSRSQTEVAAESRAEVFARLFNPNPRAPWETDSTRAQERGKMVYSSDGIVTEIEAEMASETHLRRQLKRVQAEKTALVEELQQLREVEGRQINEAADFFAKSSSEDINELLALKAQDTELHNAGTIARIQQSIHKSQLDKIAAERLACLWRGQAFRTKETLRNTELDRIEFLSSVNLTINTLFGLLQHTTLSRENLLRFVLQCANEMRDAVLKETVTPTRLRMNDFLATLDVVCPFTDSKPCSSGCNDEEISGDEHSGLKNVSESRRLFVIPRDASDAGVNENSDLKTVSRNGVHKNYPSVPKPVLSRPSKHLFTSVAYRCPGSCGDVLVNTDDLATLNPGCRLNDTIIEVGLGLWFENMKQKSPMLASEVHVFSPFLYPMLNKMGKRVEDLYDGVRKWTSKVDIFGKKYLILPVIEQGHWYLAIIYEPRHILRDSSERQDEADEDDVGEVRDNTDPITNTNEDVSEQDSEDGDTNEDDGEQPVEMTTWIFILDSAPAPERLQRATEKIETYLKLEAIDKKGHELHQTRSARRKAACVPGQPNTYDCGIYLLHFAKTFMSDPERYYKLITKEQRLPFHIPVGERQATWNTNGVTELRQSIASTIKKSHQIG